jgi:hypothetical protein
MSRPAGECLLGSLARHSGRAPRSLFLAARDQCRSAAPTDEHVHRVGPAQPIPQASSAARRASVRVNATRVRYAGLAVALAYRSAPILSSLARAAADAIPGTRIGRRLPESRRGAAGFGVSRLKRIDRLGRRALAIGLAPCRRQDADAAHTRTKPALEALPGADKGSPRSAGISPVVQRLDRRAGCFDGQNDADRRSAVSKNARRARILTCVRERRQPAATSSGRADGSGLSCDHIIVKGHHAVRPRSRTTEG